MTATDEDVEGDSEAYDCDDCEVSQYWQDLEADAANLDAWRLFHQIVGRFTIETHATGIALERLTVGLEPEAFADLLDRFAILFDVMCPPSSKEQTDT